MDAKEYEKLADALTIFKIILGAEEDIKNDRFVEAAAFFREFRRDKKIQSRGLYCRPAEVRWER